MASLQLHSAQEDRHRAVLLVDFLNTLGTRCELNDSPTAEPGAPVMVLWTRAAAGTPWLLDLFTASADSVALVIDSVALPARCERAVDLTSWPARSADSQVAGLVRWLGAPQPGGEFGRATLRRLKRQNRDKRPVSRAKTRTVDRTGIGALVVLVIVVALVSGVILRDDPSATEVASIPAPAQTRGTPVPQSSVVSTNRSSGSSAATGPGTGSVTGNARGEASSSASSAGEAVEPVSAPVAESAPVPVPSPPPATPPPEQRSSLAHLCQARSLAAAVAWYRVLEPSARARAAQSACVRELLQREGYEPLGELMAQS